MHKDREDCGVNSGEMSLPCQLEIKDLKEEIKEDISTDMKEISNDIKEMSEEISELREEINSLKSKKAEESALSKIREELSALREQIRSMDRNDRDNKDAISRLSEQINQLFNIINEYNYENGEVIAKVENFAESQIIFAKNQDEMMDIVKSIKMPTLREHALDWINSGKHPKLRKTFIYFCAGLLISALLSILLSNIGEGTVIESILEIAKELVK